MMERVFRTAAEFLLITGIVFGLLMALQKLANAETCNVNAGYNAMASETSDVSDCTDDGTDVDYVIDDAGEYLHITGDVDLDSSSSITCTAGTLHIDAGVTLILPGKLSLATSCNFVAKRELKWQGRIATLAYSGTGLGATEVRAVMDTQLDLDTDHGVVAGDYIRFSWRDLPLEPSSGLDRRRELLTLPTIPMPGEQPLSMNQGRIYRIEAVSDANTGPNGIDYDTNSAQDYDLVDGVDDGSPLKGDHDYMGREGRSASMQVSAISVQDAGRESLLTLDTDGAALFYGDLGSFSVHWIAGTCAGRRAKVIGSEDYCQDANCTADAVPQGQCTGSTTGTCDESETVDKVAVAGDVSACGTGAGNEVILSHGEGMGDLVEIYTPPVLDAEGTGWAVSRGGTYDVDGLRIIRTKGIPHDDAEFSPAIRHTTGHWILLQETDTDVFSGRFVNVEWAYPVWWDEDDAVNDHFLLYLAGTREDLTAYRDDREPLDVSGLEIRGHYAHDATGYTADGGNGDNGVHAFVAYNATGSWSEMRGERMTDDAFLYVSSPDNRGAAPVFQMHRIFGAEVLNNATPSSQNAVSVTGVGFGAGAGSSVNRTNVKLTDVVAMGVHQETLDLDFPADIDRFVAGNGAASTLIAGVVDIHLIISNAKGGCIAGIADCCEGAAGIDLVAPFCTLGPASLTISGSRSSNGVIFPWVQQGETNTYYAPGANVSNVIVTRGPLTTAVHTAYPIFTLRESYLQSSTAKMLESFAASFNGGACGTGATTSPAPGDCNDMEGASYTDSVLVGHAVNSYLADTGQDQNASAQSMERVRVVVQDLVGAGLLLDGYEGSVALTLKDFILTAASAEAQGLGDTDSGSDDPTNGGALVTNACVEATGDPFDADNGFGASKTASSSHYASLAPDLGAPLRTYLEDSGSCEAPRALGIRQLGSAHLQGLGDFAIGQLENFTTHTGLLGGSGSSVNGPRVIR